MNKKRHKMKALLSNKGMSLVSVIVLFAIGSVIVAGTGSMLVNIARLLKDIKIDKATTSYQNCGSFITTEKGQTEFAKRLFSQYKNHLNRPDEEIPDDVAFPHLKKFLVKGKDDPTNPSKQLIKRMDEMINATAIY